jgi:hypothetical protein
MQMPACLVAPNLALELSAPLLFSAAAQGNR